MMIKPRYRLMMAAYLCLTGIIHLDHIRAQSSDCDEFSDPCDKLAKTSIEPVLPDHDQGDFWSALMTWRSSGESSFFNTVLREFLVDPPSDSAARQWALGELRRISWIVDLSPFERVFLECNALHDYACSQVFLENALVFADRDSKVALLRKALNARDSRNRVATVQIDFRGFRFDSDGYSAAILVRDLGLRELYGEARKAVGAHAIQSGLATHDDWERWLTLTDEFVGTDSGNQHPAAVLNETLGNQLPSEIIGRLLEEDRSFGMFISGFPARLRYPQREWKSDDCTTGDSLRLESEEYLPLMSTLGAVYREFLENPPTNVLKNTCTFDSANQAIRFFLRGGCNEIGDIDQFAFDSDQEATKALWDARQLATR